MIFGTEGFRKHLLMAPQPDAGGGAAVVADPAVPVAPPTTQTSPEQHGVTGPADPATPAGTTIDPNVVPSMLQEPAAPVVQPGAPIVPPVEPVAPVVPVVPPVEPASTLTDPNATPNAPVVPPVETATGDEEFEITLADDSPLSETQFNKLMDFVDETGLNKEQAEKLIKEQSDMFTIGAQGAHAQMKADSESNRQKLLNDPEIGGDKWAESVKIMALPIKQFGDASFTELINSDIGNHPALGKFLYRLGNAMKSPDFVGKGKGAAPTEVANPLKERYPSMFEDEK